MGLSQSSLLSGARGRLLDFSIPFRFFVAAGVYHLVFWFYFLVNASALPAYAGGPGPVLTGIHLLTLGVLVMTAVGAALQLLSVATMQPFKALWLCRLISWLMIPGVALLTWGMFNLDYYTLISGVTMVALALIFFSVLIISNLISAPNIGVITAYSWVAILALVLVVLLGLALSLDYFYPLTSQHRQLGITHMVLAGYGFMGMLSMGFSYILIPMFSLSPAPDSKIGYAGFVFCTLALLIAVLNTFFNQPWLYIKAVNLGIIGSGIYLFGMYQSLKQRMRKRLEASFKLIYVSWFLLIVSLLLAAALALGVIRPAVFGVVLLVGWLLTFLLAVLQRIVPFLASMHSSKNKGKTLMVSQLTHQKALNVCNISHPTAFILLFAGVCLNMTVLIQLASLAGIVAAGALLYFLLFAVRRTLQVSA